MSSRSSTDVAVGPQSSIPHAAIAGQSSALRVLRFLLLGCGVAAFAVGLWTGFARLGVGLTGAAPQLVEFHGALMICGFFGTLISLERAVAFNRPFAYLIPLSAAIGVFALLAKATTLAGTAFLIASVGLAAASLWNARRFGSVLLAVVPSIAALCWGLGTLLWLANHPAAESAAWWLAFLVLTVAAERLELSRVATPPPIARVFFIAVVIALLTGVARGELDALRSPFLGAGLLACGAWLLIYDLARRTVRLNGQIRFGAMCMLLGYGWLIIAGLELLARPLQITFFWYDATVHAVTLGFVLSMVFGHTLIIFPSVIGLKLRYSAVLYLPLLLLQISVAIRTVADFAAWMALRLSSGFLTVAAVALFAVIIGAASVLVGHPPSRKSRGSANRNGSGLNVEPSPPS
jgi:hypothetical protein